MHARIYNDNSNNSTNTLPIDFPLGKILHIFAINYITKPKIESCYWLTGESRLPLASAIFLGLYRVQAEQEYITACYS